MNISFTDTTEYILTARDKDFSNFYIRPKSDFLKEKKNNTIIISFMNEGIYSEKSIIEKMKKSKFYTYYKGKFIEIIEVDGHIKSKSNDTLEDNLKNLPIINV